MTSKNIMNQKEFFEILNEIPFGVLIMSADWTRRIKYPVSAGAN